MGAEIDSVHSTLDVVQSVYQTYRRNGTPPTDSEKQVVPQDEKQVAPDDGKYCVVEDAGIELAPKKDFYAPNFRNHYVQSSRKKGIVYGGTIGTIAIIALVLGLVLGLRTSKSSTTPPLTSSSNSSAASLPATSSSATSPSAISSSATSASATTSLVQPSQRSIAALSFASESGNNTRVYFQDNVGQILEAANSVGNATWSVNRIGIGGKNGSAIAAAVSRPNFPLTISVLYLDTNDIIHDIIYNDSTGKWTPGTLSGHGYIAISNSSLAAMYNQCKLCANTTIIAFQDDNGFVQMGNLTSGGWTLTQLGSELDPAIGTGLALQPFYRGGLPDQVNLYHQKSYLNLSLACWGPPCWEPPLINDVPGWSLNAQTYNAIPAGSSIAAASSYSNVSTGFETWIEVLSVFDKGFEVNTWSGAINGWLEDNTHPSAMVNLTGTGNVYGGVAVTAMGSAFGVVKLDGQVDKIESWQVADDTVDWSFTGNVDLDGAWG